MIKLFVCKDKNKRIVLLSKTPPKNCVFIFRTRKPNIITDKQILKMWSEFDEKHSNSSISERDSWQFNQISSLIKKHFGLDLKLKKWPCDIWPMNKRWINCFIRENYK